MKKIALILFCVTYINSNSIIHLTSIKKQYAESQNIEKYENFKKQLIKYYESGEFDSELEKICQKAVEHLLKIPKPENGAIIFDIDETALSHYPLCKEKNFNWSLDDDIIPYRQKAICPAIEPVLKFYKLLMNEGYKIIFLTSRRNSTYNATHKNLIEQGYHKFEELILMPMDLFKKGMKHELWKANVRSDLSKKYNIVASISDSQKDFEGGNTGYQIKLPNYLY